jgi:hypothetical protein
MNEKEINDLLKRYIDNEVTPAESAMINQWFNVYTTDSSNFNEINTIEEVEYQLIAGEKFLIHPDAPKIITDVRLVNQKILERIKRDPYEMYGLSSRQFEMMCAELYEERGYKVILTQETRDGGKDLIILDDSALGKFMIYGECKRYTPDNAVGVNVVKQLIGNIWADKATAGVVMTSSYFSPDAKTFANKFEHQLSLIDFTRLHQMITVKP